MDGLLELVNLMVLLNIISILLIFQFGQAQRMQQNESLTIPQASILFYSDHYIHLKCKIIQKESNITLSSKLINNCIETTFNINRTLTQFFIELYQGSLLVGVFSFDFDDLEEALAQDNCQYKIGNRRRKYVKFRKENDCCSLFFTVQVRDFVGDQRNHHEEYIYEDFVRNIACKVYKKLQTKALQRIQRLQSNKLQNKRMSVDNPDNPTPTPKPPKNHPTNSKHQKQPKQNQSSKFMPSHRNSRQHVQQKQNQHGNEDQKITAFAQSWTYSLGKDLLFGKQSQHQMKKNRYRLKKMRERARKMFSKEIQKVNEKDMVIIPKVRMDRRNMGLMSEGIVFPARIKSEINQIGIKLDGFIKTFQLDNHIQNLNHKTFTSHLFQPQSSTSKKSYRTSRLKQPDEPLLPKNQLIQINLPKNPPQCKSHTSKRGILKKQAVCPDFAQTVIVNSKVAIKYKDFR